MRTLATRVRALIAILLVGSSVFFAVGAMLERNESQHDEPAVETAGPEAAESTEAESGEEATSEAGETEEAGEADERILGINPDSPWAVGVAILASLALAAAVLLVGSTSALVLTGLFALAFAAGDLRELVRQLDESNAGIAVVAAVLAVAHLLVAALAASLLRRRAGTAETAGRLA